MYLDSYFSSCKLIDIYLHIIQNNARAKTQRLTYIPFQMLLPHVTKAFLVKTDYNILTELLCYVLHRICTAITN